MKESKKVPLKIGWLCETGLFYKAAHLLGIPVVSLPPSDEGVFVVVDGKEVVMRFEDELLFTVAHLIELDFERGEIRYCPNCKRLQAECDEEQAEIYEHNHSWPEDSEV